MSKLKFATVTSLLACLSQNVFATNGLEAIGLGHAHKGMGGAAIANPINTSSMMSNPAAINNVKAGYDAGVDLFLPDRVAIRKSDGKEFSGNETDKFLVPDFSYKKRQSADSKYSVGFAAYASGGLNTDYAANNSPTLNGTPYNFNPFNPGVNSGNTGIDLKQLVLSPTIGIKANDKHSFGLSVNLVLQEFKAEGVSLFSNPDFTTNSAGVSNNGSESSTGLGFTLGWQGQLTDKIDAGAFYRSKVDMKTFDKYQGLLTNGGNLNMPSSFGIGLGIKATPKTKVAFDIKRINYTDYPEYSNPARLIPTSVANATPFQEALFGGSVGFGWEDMTIYKLGVSHHYKPDLTLYAGLNYGSDPSPEDGTNLNIIAPAITERHLTLGFEKKLSKNSSWTGSYIRVFPNELVGDAASVPIPQQYDIRSHQHAVGVSYGRTF